MKKLNKKIFSKRVKVLDLIKWSVQPTQLFEYFLKNFLISKNRCCILTALVLCLVYTILTVNDNKNLSSLTAIPGLLIIACFLSVKPGKVI